MVTVVDNFMMAGFVRAYTGMLDATERLIKLMRYTRDEKGAIAMETLVITGAVVVGGIAVATIITALNRRAASNVGGGVNAFTTATPNITVAS